MTDTRERASENPLVHSLHGNIAWRWLAAAAFSPILLRVEQGAVDLAGDARMAVNIAVQVAITQ